MWLLPLRLCGLLVRRHVLRVHTLLLLTIAAFFVFIGKDSLSKVSLGSSMSTLTTTTLPSPVELSQEQQRQVLVNRRANKDSSQPDRAQLRMQWLKNRIDKASRRTEKNSRVLDVPSHVPTNYNIHVFYYAWYESMAHDGKWEHWNHEYLPSWKSGEKNIHPTGRHVPPDDIGANFYPQLGCYSSRDPAVIDKHMAVIKDSGIGVLVVSWYPPGLSDAPEIAPPDSIFAKFLDAAVKYDLRVAPHIEPYKDRNPVNFRKHMEYFFSEYGNHPGLYRKVNNGKPLPMVYVYDSYRTAASSWRELLARNGNNTLRGTPIDAIYLGLLVDMQHKHEVTRAHFDGFYTYFASNGFAYGSTWKNWKLLSKFATDSNLFFVPSVGPGYVDTRVRPWNTANSRHRRGGAYYDVGWRTALNARVTAISITSFNEWHEGTQIEPAVPFSTQHFKYLDYEPEGAMLYMELTKSWVHEFSKKINSTDKPITIT